MIDSSTPPPKPPPATKPPMWLSFSGPITHPASNKLRNALSSAATQGHQEITVLFASNGGSVEDGFALYAFLRSLPVKLTMFSVGAIDSIAIPVFLSADSRFCCPTSRFLFHDVLMTFTANQSSQAHVYEQTLLLDTARKSIYDLLKSRTLFTEQDFETLELLKEPRIIDPATAKEKGIVQEIKEAKIPAGAVIFNVEY